MIKFLKYIFSGQRKYFLKIINATIQDDDITCRIYDKMNVNPYANMLASEILKNDNLLSQIRPREILKLKELYDEIKGKCVFLIETRQKNKYKILYHDHEFTMEGKDICKDMKLLGSMRIEDAFGIIYNTGYQDAMKNNNAQLNLAKETPKNKKQNNIIPLKK